MFKKILVPLDRSSLAEQILPHLRWLAPADTTEIALVSVIEPQHHYYGSDIYTPASRNTVHKHVQRYLEGQSERLRKLGHTVSTHVIEGDPAGTILELAKEGRADLIAMSTHGRSGFIRWALGSVAERVIQGATMPIFLVSEHAPVPVGQELCILVPLDGSELAEQALPLAQEVTLSTRARILLLRVLDVLDKEDLGLYFEDEADVAETMARWRLEAQAYLEQVAERLRSGGIVVDTRVMSGQPDKIICNVATHEHIGVIVMGTHGRSGLSRWVYGSTANKVLHTVDCPLLLVRAAWHEGNEPSVRVDDALHTLPI